MNERISWDEYFIEEAARVASRSKDPSKKVGAIIVRPDKTEASRGYNGFPAGIDDTNDRLNDPRFKNLVILHAEENSLWFARREDLTGYTLYVTPYMPCAHCAAQIIRAGIKRVVTDMGEFSEKWRENFEITKTIFAEAGVELAFVGEKPVANEHKPKSLWKSDVPYNGEPFFEMKDMRGDGPTYLCRVIEGDPSHFSIIGKYKWLGLDGPQTGWFEGGIAYLWRGKMMKPEVLGCLLITWRGQ